MQRVGWIRIGALGDLLVGLASLREVLERWPDHQMTVVGSKLWLQLIEPGHWPQIDRIAVVEKRGSEAEVFEISNREWVSKRQCSLREELSQCRVVFNARVDSPRQGFAAFWARVPERWGSAAGLTRFIYNRRGPHDGKDPLIHERDVPLLLMDEAESIENGRATFTGKTLQERITESPRIRRWREQGLASPRRADGARAKKLLGGVDRYFIVNPTSSRREKAWPSAKFAKLLAEIRMRAELPGLMPIVVGAPNETEWLQEVAGADFKIYQPKTLSDLFDVVAGAEFLLTNTSSVQFVAAAVGTRTLTLMGRAKPEIWGPLGPKDRYLLGTEPLDVESMFERERLAYETIDVEHVISELKNLRQA